MPQLYQSNGDKILAHTRQQMAKLHGVSLDVIQSGEQFSISPEVQQKLESKMMLSDAFLSKITNELVRDLSGQKVYMNINEPVSRRTARRGPRKPVDKLKLTQDQYMLSEVERDVEMDWKKVDTWSGRHAEFFSRFMALCNKRRAQDTLITGWHGQFIEPLTDPDVFTMLQDVNIGWIQYMINVAPEKVLGLKPDGTVDPINVGEGGDYANMHELVHHMGETLIDLIHRDRTDIRCITGREMIADRKGKLYARWGGDSEPTEQDMLEAAVHSNDYADRVIQRSAFAPQRLVFLSPLDNFSRYVQRGTTRTKPIYNDHDDKAIKDLMYLYESFQMEDVDACAMLHPDAIHLKNKAGDWVPLSAEKKWAVIDPTPEVDPV